jgi:hypothetical protein
MAPDGSRASIAWVQLAAGLERGFMMSTWAAGQWAGAVNVGWPPDADPYRRSLAFDSAADGSMVIMVNARWNEYAPLRASVWSQGAWSTPMVLDPSVYGSVSVDLAAGTTIAAVAWDSASPSSPNGTVRSAQWNGTQWSAAQDLGASTRGSELDVSISADGANTLVAFTSSPNGTAQMNAALRTRDGWTAASSFRRPGDRYVTFPSATVSSVASAAALVAWDSRSQTLVEVR